MNLHYAHPDTLYREHRCVHNSLADLLWCPTFKDHTAIYIYIQGDSRLMSIDELIVLGLRPQKPKEHALNCHLTAGTSPRQVLSANTIKSLTRNHSDSLNRLNNNKNSILSRHRFYTQPVNYLNENSRRRILPIDLVEKYQEDMEKLMDNYVSNVDTLLHEIQKLNLPEGQIPTPTPDVIAASLHPPTYKISKPTRKQTWNPTNETFTPTELTIFHNVCFGSDKL